jgi:hypothetical protein
MEELWELYAKWKKTVTKQQILYDYTYIQDLQNLVTESRMVVARDWKKKKVGVVQFCKRKKILSGQLHYITTVWMCLHYNSVNVLNATLLYT